MLHSPLASDQRTSHGWLLIDRQEATTCFGNQQVVGLS